MNNENIINGEFTAFTLRDNALKKSCDVVLIKVDGQLTVLQKERPYVDPNPVKKSKKPFNWRLAVTRVVAAGLLTVTLTAGAYGVAKLGDATIGEYFREKSRYETVLVEANTILVASGLHVVPDFNTNEWNNNYANIIATEDDLYGLTCYLGVNEAEKILPNFGYQTWDEYFIAKGYVDENGKPSSTLWVSAQVDRIRTETTNEKGVKK